MDTKVSPGHSFYRLRERHLAEEHPDPRRQVELRHVHRARPTRATSAPRRSSSSAKGAPGSEERKIADYYAASWTRPAIEKAGHRRRSSRDLDAIAKIKDAEGLVDAFATQPRQLPRRRRSRRASARTTRIPSTTSPSIGQGGLGLPDRDMYDAKNKQFEPLRAGYKKYLGDDARRSTGAKDADKRAAAVYALEEKLAKTHWTRIQNRDPQKTYNKMTIAQLEKLAPGFDWKAWLEGVGPRKADRVQRQPADAIAGAAKLVKSEPLAVWKDYLTVARCVSEAAPYLPKAVRRRAVRDVRQDAVGHAAASRTRWKRGVDVGHRRDGRGRRQALRREVLHAGDQGARRRARAQPARRDGPAPRRPRRG